MKAWFLTGPNKMDLKEVDEPTVKEGFIKVQMLTVQPSITETQIIKCEGDPFGISDRIKSGQIIPLPGHELCAKVIETGPNSKFKVGDRVASLAKITCDSCTMCKSNNPQLCEKMEILGITFGGVFAEKTLLKESALALVPDDLTNQEAACLQPMADCVAAVETAKIKMGDTVAFYGAGCLGMNTMQVARCSGAGKLIVVDVRDDVLAMAKKLGAHYIINGKKEDPVRVIKDITGGVGADIIFEAAGGNPAIGLAGTVALRQAIESLKPEGCLLIMAIYGAIIEFPIGQMRFHGKKVFMPKMSTVKHMYQAGRLIASGQLQLKQMINYSFVGLDKTPSAYEITANKGEKKSIMPAQVNII
jgi:threonine dehydrogenase-like Zn-dependent dehydrogenase